MEILSNLHEYNDWGLLALRIGVGIIFIVHGKMKFAMWKMEPSEQMPAQMISLMKFLSITETLGGVALIVGFLTQIVALGFVIIMLGAINLKIKMMKEPFTSQEKAGWEFDFILLTASLMIIFSGAGGFAVDRLLFGI